MRFAVFASGRGSNLQAIIDAVKRREIKAELALVISDRSEAYALKRARRAGVKSFFIDPKAFVDRESFDREAVRYLRRERIDFIVLAGFMRILSPYFIRSYRNRVLNVHPALLPQFKGAHAIQDAFRAKVKETGVTIHFVDEKVDHGPVILQEALAIKPNDTLAGLEKKIHKIEHRLYPRAVDLFARGRVEVKGRKVWIGRGHQVAKSQGHR